MKSELDDLIYAYTKVKSPIVYYGGKTSILNHILPLIPEHEVYTEVFLGGGAVFWAKRPVRNETINDRLDLVINFYRVLKLRYRPLKKLVEATLISRAIHKEALTVIRYPRDTPPTRPGVAYRVRLAWAFWVCTNFAYSNKIGGGYKYSNDQSVSVPRTLQARKSAFTERLVARLENAYIESEDAIKVLQSRNRPQAFHYIDPPYFNADQGHYAGYTLDDYIMLLDWLAHFCKGSFMLSSYNSPYLEEYIQRFGWHKTEITRRIGGGRDSMPCKYRDSRVEVLVRNYATPCRTLDLFDQAG